MSPINAGQLLLLPDRALYKDGLRVLRAGFHGATLGWNASGAPFELFRGQPLYTREGSHARVHTVPARCGHGSDWREPRC